MCVTRTLIAVLLYYYPDVNKRQRYIQENFITNISRNTQKHRSKVYFDIDKYKKIVCTYNRFH